MSLILLLAHSLLSQTLNCPTFPDDKVCRAKNWDLGDQIDPCAPDGPYPVKGQQVYIKDPRNFCINLPNPNSPALKSRYYDNGKLPTIVAAEGYVQSFCMGEYISPGALRLPKSSILSAHVIKNEKNGIKYFQISGKMDCSILNINCNSSLPEAYDDGGQYDSVSYRQCGKEPYSGVDNFKHPGYIDYVEQAGNGYHFFKC
jgi:hypothetical protein